MKIINGICKVIDTVNDWIGRICSFSVLGVLAVILCEVTLRRLFNKPQIWTQDLICMIFGCYIILIAAYGFQKKAFVAVDVLFAHFPVLAQYILHLVTYLVFLVPFVFGLLPKSWAFFVKAYVNGERSYSVWAPPTWPVKFCLFAGLLLLAIQSLSEILKQVSGIIGSCGGKSETGTPEPSEPAGPKGV
jgi:TRAP-type mannitol/chloroaromatic compound transport system permease small subunit